MYPNRTICDVISELRKCNDTRNFGYYLSLVEEMQSMANKMEAKLSDLDDIKDYQEQRTNLNHEVNKLTKELDKLKEKKKLLENE